MSSQPGGDPSVCYKTDNCNYDYCVEKKEQCYWSSDCQYDYCIKPGYQPMTTAQDTDNAGGKSAYYFLYIRLF